MAFQDSNLFAALGIPDTGGVVVRGCEHLLSISAEGRAADRADVASQTDELLTAAGIPDTGRARLCWRRDHSQAIRAEGHARQPFRAFQRGDFSAGLGVKNADPLVVLVVAERHHPHSIRAETRHHLVIVLAFNYDELRAALGIPDAGRQVLRRCQHPAAIWTEDCAPDMIPMAI